MLEVFRKLHDEKEVRRFYVGGSLGVDMWAAEQILRLKEQPGYENIELVVALPFVGHDAKWNQRSKRRMRGLYVSASGTLLCLSRKFGNSSSNFR